MSEIKDTLPAYTNYTDLQGFEGLKKQAKQDQQQALKPVAQQFEALFLQQILKEARQVKFDDGFLSGGQSDFYQDWYDKQLAQDLAAKGSIGLADKLVEQLSPTLPQAQTEKQETGTMESTQKALTLRSLGLR
ncbi:rod-binding protein [Thiomicrorhabdus heinhorstiae]|uniref:Rod-binding protein n=1 Tax=Thiomicrorhabdus heinhorstiae TaxID=2748010 RepID=A0ABS0BY08_9GAMM|nr:rod-binding protein [Thiomicrorhabdus heinhorstiae]MBF6058677.1 rod-binding protein [Thiomicrorhabdus heinhorstiae]